jgi:hypothetical protein
MTPHPHIDLHSTDVATRMTRVFMSNVARRWRLSDRDMVLLFQLAPASSGSIGWRIKRCRALMRSS